MGGLDGQAGNEGETGFLRRAHQFVAGDYGGLRWIEGEEESKDEVGVDLQPTASIADIVEPWAAW